MILVFLACVYPFYYCIIISLNEGKDAARGFIYFFPRKFTLENYSTALSDQGILHAYLVTVIRTVVGTVATVYFNAMVAYALIKKELYLRKFYVSIGIITMFFGGGMIPFYLLIKSLGLLNNFWVYIIPGLGGFFTILLYMAFFREIPASMVESAKMDGANEFYIFVRIILPLSTPVLATIALFAGVGHFNSWFDNYIYCSNINLRVMSLILMQMINQNLAAQILVQKGYMDVETAQSFITPISLRIATMIISILPIMAIYPFLQKYFVKGIMIGAVKG